jgi:hypothetical protein
VVQIRVICGEKLVPKPRDKGDRADEWAVPEAESCRRDDEILNLRLST